MVRLKINRQKVFKAKGLQIVGEDGERLFA